MDWIEDWRKKKLEAITDRAKAAKAELEAECIRIRAYNPQAAPRALTPGSDAGPAQDPGKVACEQCGAEIKDSKRQDGSTWTAADKAKYSREKHGKVLCYKCGK